MRILTHTVLPEEDGRMVKGILRGSLQLSYTLLKSLKWRENAILLNGQNVHVNAIVRAVGLEHVGAGGAEREDGAGILSRQEREDGTIGPGHVGIHVGQACHKALWQVGERHEQHAPHAAQGVDIGVGAVRHRVAAKQVGHERQLMRGKAWKCDSRKRQ